MYNFKDKVILITGAGRGIGRALAYAFAKNGAIIAANDLTPINLDHTLMQIKSFKGQAKGYIYDIAKRMPVGAMIDQIVNDWGGIDILINNAALSPTASLLDMDEWDWRRTIDVNLSAPFFMLQAVAKIMMESDGGVIVNIASNAGRAHGVEGKSAYIASKMGLLGLTRVAAQEFASYNIRVNAVCPGLINEEPMTELSKQNETHELRLDVPQRKKGAPEDVVKVVLFLCSGDSAYITGQSINVDGGQVMC